MIKDINSGKMDNARLVASELLSKGFKRIDCYYVLSVIETSANNMARAEKYLRNGLSTIEYNLPLEQEDWILNGQLYPNGIYLRTLVNLGLHYMAISDNEKALQILQKAYHLDPWDHAGARYHIHSITNENLPEITGEDNHIRPINPYRYANKYRIPLHDSYDPNSRPNPATWVALDPVYRDLIIREYHKTNPDQLSTEETDGHIAIHAIAETALADNAHPQPRALLAQYLVAGYSRHDAIHAIGQMLLNQVIQNLQRNQGQSEEDISSHEHDHTHVHGPGCRHDHGVNESESIDAEKHE
jgi:hypothetical protein